ncbi:zinc ribbon domain-containing protein [Thalassobacillus pellis]|uniref:zinc ribbon domain-containing protein n=1 Tax=Thalassobacillus pellis TaxID=748008 RepID=UPI00195FFAEA|nr:zinc ribbon domain-containing protein [Thalassobacillus pellis]MBM7553089.1 tetratricopeptide (TPR) repeat protein [Thalassobacillus pellis]
MKGKKVRKGEPMKTCPNCNSEINEGSRFCPNCGARIEDGAGGQKEEMAAIRETGAGQDSRKTNKHKTPKKRANWFAIFIPVVVFLIAAGWVGYTYAKEQDINEEVLQLKNDAEALAIDGKYEKAKKLLDQAIQMRDDFPALKQDREFVQNAIEVEKELDNISEHIQSNQLEKANAKIDQIRKRVEESESKLMLSFNGSLDTLATQVEIKRINNELAELKTVDELAAKLSTVSSYEVQEAVQVKGKILEKIVSIASRNAEEHIAGKEFNKAIAVVDDALQFAVNNEKLLQLKERIKQEKAAFEQAQQERIKRALEKAAQEDIKNRTSAIEVTELKAKLDDLGDLTVTGKVKSVATKIISSVTLELEVKNKEGKVVAKEKTTVYPMYMNPGDTGKFEKKFFDINEEVNVEVINMEWYVE